jgi:hypothetical protein
MVRAQPLFLLSVQKGMQAIRQEPSGPRVLATASNLSPVAHALRIVALMLSACCGVATANPRPSPPGAGAVMNMTSEHLSATLSPAEARLEGTFEFRYRPGAKTPSGGYEVAVEVPVWFPAEDPADPSITAFWAAFKSYAHSINDQNRVAFQRSINLSVYVGEHPMPIGYVIAIPSTDPWPLVPREWLLEPGWRCLLFRAGQTNSNALAQGKVTVSYRQPLVHTKSEAGFFYLPSFPNSPKGASTADPERYSIRITAAPGCRVAVTSGDRKVTLDGGQSTLLSPKHHQPIRATVTSPNRVGGRVDLPPPTPPSKRVRTRRFRLD